MEKNEMIEEIVRITDEKIGTIDNNYLKEHLSRYIDIDIEELHYLIKKYLEKYNGENKSDIIRAYANPRCLKFPLLQYASALLIYEKGNYDKVLKIAKHNSKFKPFDELIKKTKEKKYCNNAILSILFTKLYVDNLSLDEIEQSNLNEKEKLIIKTAYYEKYNKSNGLLFLKEVKKNSNEDTKLLNSLINKLQDKKSKIINYHFYKKYVYFDIMLDKVDLYKKEEKKEKQQVLLREDKIKKLVNDKKIEKKQPNKPIIVKTIKKVEINKNTLKPDNKVLVKENITIKKEKKEKVGKKITIKHVLYFDILELQCHIYNLMCKDETRVMATKAWDILDDMIDKDIHDEKYLNKVVSLLNKIKDNSSMNISCDPKTYQKYLKNK